VGEIKKIHLGSLEPAGCVSHYVCVFLLVDCVVSFSQASYSVTEGDALTISIVISNPSQNTFSVQVLGTEPPLTVSAGATSFNFSTTKDNICEDNETFNLTIDASSLPDGCVIGNPGSVTVTVEDDDGEYIELSLNRVII